MNEDYKEIVNCAELVQAIGELVGADRTQIATAAMLVGAAVLGSAFIGLEPRQFVLKAANVTKMDDPLVGAIMAAAAETMAGGVDIADLAAKIRAEKLQ